MSDFDNVIKMMNKQWNEVEIYFKNNSFDYNSYKDLTNLPFYDWMFQMLDEAIHTLVIDTGAIRTLYRAVKDINCKHDRFIPQKEYASDNRMNGKDKLYYYFGASYKTYKREAIVTCLKEIRTKDEMVSVCKFDFIGDKNKIEIIDFTRDNSMPRSEDDLKKYIYKYISRDGKLGSYKAIAKVLINFLCNSVAFEPIDKEKTNEYELRYKYIPFWAITDYLENMGYNGLLFSSTVDDRGKNLVLFKLDHAKYVEGTIESFNSNDYLKNRL